MKVTPLLSKFNSENFIEELLTAYGITDTKAFLNPNTGDFQNETDYPNMEIGFGILKDTVEKGGQIGIIVDADLDGVASSIITRQMLRLLGVEPIMFYHKGKAHGISNDIVDEIVNSNINLLIVPDAAVPKSRNTSAVLDKGIKILVVDHHVPDKAEERTTLINPYLGTDLNRSLSGAGVTFKFASYVCKQMGIEVPYWLDLVATSIVSDCCALSQENRAFLYYGLHNIQNPMLRFLFEELAHGADKVVPADVGWSIAPKINAMTRVDSEMNILLDGFCGGDVKEGLRVAKDAYNRQSELVKNALEEMTINNDHKIVIGYIDNKYAPLTGLIAGKLQSEYSKPAFVVRETRDGYFTGSMRSPFEIANLLNGSHFCECRGHESASGVSFYQYNFENLMEFIDNSEIEDVKGTPVTAVLNIRRVSNKMCEELQQYNDIFCNNCPIPTFYSKVRVLPKNIRIFKKATNTTKITIGGLEIMKFRTTKAELDMLEANVPLQIEMIYTLGTNEFNGKVSNQAVVQKWEIKVDNDDFEF